MVHLTLDGKTVGAEAGEPLLEVARRQGKEIPTLCHHPALEPYGACRLCIVEVERRSSRKIVTSCNFPAEDGLTVWTDSPRVMNNRRLILELLLARCPGVEAIERLAKVYGSDGSRFRKSAEKCILCGLCVRVCEEVIGVSAISFAGRGVDRRVVTPFEQSSSECIGCGACAAVCPTGAISIEEVALARRVNPFATEVEMARCARCGAPVGPSRQIAFIRKKLNLPEEILGVCAACRRKEYGKKLLSVSEAVRRKT